MTKVLFSKIGIGIGLSQYLGLISRLPRNTPLYIMDWSHISMRMTAVVPSPPSTLALFRAMLTEDNHSKACFVGHSLGTAAVSWALRDEATQPFVGATVFIDPICFLLCDPSVAYSFLYRVPSSLVDVVLNYFASTELHIAYTLSRHFYWDWNMLFVEDLPKGARNVVVLCLKDSIVPARAIVRYFDAKLQDVRKEGPALEDILGGKVGRADVPAVECGMFKGQEDDDRSAFLEVETFEGAQHGACLLNKEMVERIVNRICFASGVMPDAQGNGSTLRTATLSATKTKRKKRLATSQK